MANKDSFPDYSEKQKLLFDEKKNPAILTSYGDEFFKAEMLDTALDFFIESGDKDRIKKIIEAAVDNGDFYLFKKAAFSIMDEKEIKEKAAKLAESAEKLGKYLFSNKALEYFDKKDGAKEINSGKEEKVD